MSSDVEPIYSPPTPFKQLSPSQQKQRLTELAAVFLKLGTIAFGGPPAHIAMMDDEVVTRRRWMSRETLLDLLGVTNLIPGPNSTELAIHVGLERGGWRGLIVAGSCFILPATLIVWALAALYVQYQTLPQLGWLLYGVKPVIIAIVVKALWQLTKKAAKDWPTIVGGIVALVGYLVGWNELLLLFLIGLAVMGAKNWQRDRLSGAVMLPVSGLLAQAGGTVTTVVTASWVSVFLFFLKVGCVLYGGGYVLLAFLQRDLVERNQWITSQQLLDAIAIGQVTPGPVFTTATFVGYLIAGHAGAIAGTVGIFLPAFVLVWLINPFVPKLRQSPLMSGFLDGLNAASLGLMAGVTIILARAAVFDWVTLVVAMASAIAVFRFKLNSVWLILGGGMIGIAAYLLGWTV